MHQIVAAEHAEDEEKTEAPNRITKTIEVIVAVD